MLSLNTRCEDGETRNTRDTRGCVPLPRGCTPALFAASFASVMYLLSSFWQHLSSSASATGYETATYGAIRREVVGLAAALRWVSVFSQALVLVGPTVTTLTIQLVHVLV